MKSVTRTQPDTPKVKPQVLVIDDEPLVGVMLKRLLARHYEVTSASNGTEGLELARGQRWDAIVCDIMMPGLSGPEILAHLREENHPSAARIGFMTGGAFDTATRVFLEDLGQQGWLAKPFGRDKVLAFIEHLRPPQSVE